MSALKIYSTQVVLNAFFNGITLEELKAIEIAYPDNIRIGRRMFVDIKMNQEFARKLTSKESELTCRGSLGFAKGFDFLNLTDVNGRIDAEKLSMFDIVLLLKAIFKRQVKESSRSLKNLFKCVIVYLETINDQTLLNNCVRVMKDNLNGLNYSLDGRHALGNKILRLFPNHFAMSITNSWATLSVVTNSDEIVSNDDAVDTTVEEVVQGDVSTDSSTCTLCGSPLSSREIRIDNYSQRYCTNDQCSNSFIGAMATLSTRMAENLYSTKILNKTGAFNCYEILITLKVQRYLEPQAIKSILLDDENNLIGSFHSNIITTIPIPLAKAKKFIENLGDVDKNKIFITNILNVDEDGKKVLTNLMNNINYGCEVVIDVDNMSVSRNSLSASEKFERIFTCQTDNKILKDYKVLDNTLSYSILERGGI